MQRLKLKVRTMVYMNQRAAEYDKTGFVMHQLTEFKPRIAIDPAIRPDQWTVRKQPRKYNNLQWLLREQARMLKDERVAYVVKRMGRSVRGVLRPEYALFTKLPRYFFDGECSFEC